MRHEVSCVEYSVLGIFRLSTEVVPRAEPKGQQLPLLATYVCRSCEQAVGGFASTDLAEIPVGSGCVVNVFVV